jgi:hypothetical protein
MDGSYPSNVVIVGTNGSASNRCAIGKAKQYRLMKICLCNAPDVVIPKLINTAKCPAVVNLQIRQVVPHHHNQERT